MWRYESQGNGLFVTIYSPDGRSVALQGDDAAAFVAELDLCDDYDSARDVCEQYADLCE